MILQLKVTSKEASALGDRAIARFDAAGGTIGRGQSSDWVLPDTDAVLSRQHAEIAFTGGRFELIDLSSNGTFVNGRPVASMPGRRVALAHADRIELGGYILAAEIEANRVEPVSAPQSAPSGAPAPGAEPDTPDMIDALLGDLGEIAAAQLAAAPAGSPAAERPGQASARPAEPPVAIPEGWDPLADEGPSPAAAHPAPLVGAKSDIGSPGIALRRTPAPVPPAPSLGRVAALRAPAPAAPSPPAAAPSPAAPSPAQPAATAPQGAANDAFWTALCGTVPTDADAATMAQLGTALRLSLEHLMDLLAARRDVKTQFRLEQTQIAAEANNPLKFMRSIDNLVGRVVIAGELGYQPIGQAVDGAFQDIKAHEVATASAMQSAMNAIVRQFAPDTLKQRLEASGTVTSGRSGTLAKAQYWEEFVAHYGDLAEGAADHFDRVFQDEFARAYAAYVEGED